VEVEKMIKIFRRLKEKNRSIRPNGTNGLVPYPRHSCENEIRAGEFWGVS